jgi:hypothetical protein
MSLIIHWQVDVLYEPIAQTRFNEEPMHGSCAKLAGVRSAIRQRDGAAHLRRESQMVYNHD